MVGLIVTKSKNNVIREEGKDKLDELTINNTVIMDKEFFESIKYPLPNRLNKII